MAKLGTLAWMAKSQGKLDLQDKMALIFQGVRAKAAMVRRSKVRHKARYCDVEDILPPDSPIALEALAVSEEASDPYLLNHCFRAYFWAKLMDEGNIKYDDE